ncbi:MAG: hypothetical protein K1X61_10605 [Chitinophagales bacterium]|nr:hypothetical protein [Chitinophagales bacterium]
MAAVDKSCESYNGVSIATIPSDAGFTVNWEGTERKSALIFNNFEFFSQQSRSPGLQQDLPAGIAILQR